MADENQDIFGKIDALFGKRAGFVGGQASPEDEFPLLTEVVDEPAPTPAVARVGDALSSQPPAIADASAAMLDDIQLDRLAAALEARLSELFIRQQMRVESLVRRVVREELDRRD